MDVTVVRKLVEVEALKLSDDVRVSSPTDRCKIKLKLLVALATAQVTYYPLVNVVGFHDTFKA